MRRNEKGDFEDFHSNSLGTDPKDVKGKMANKGTYIVPRYIRYKLLNPDHREKTRAELDAVRSPVVRAAIAEADKKVDEGSHLKSYWEYAYVFAGFENFVLEYVTVHVFIFFFFHFLSLCSSFVSCSCCF